MDGLITFGDSLAVGVGQALHAERNLGIVGWGLYRKDVQERLAELHAASDGKTVLISVGTNDTPGKDYPLRLRRLRESVADGARVAWLLPPKACGRTLPAERIVPMIDSLAQEFGDRVIDASRCDGERAADGVHYTPRGYRRIGEEALR